MSAGLAAQGLNFLEALGVGAALGCWYDLLRVGRERARGRLAAALLDLLFWLTAVAALFLFALIRGDGRIRLYLGAAFLLGGGGYFLTLSPSALWCFRKFAELLALFSALISAPLRAVWRALKKISKKEKKDFQIWLDWYKINMLYHQPQKGVGTNRETETGRSWHKIRHTGALVATLTALLTLNAQLDEARSARDALSQQVLAQAESNAALAEDIANCDDPEQIAAIAREKLGLIGQDEIVFVDTSK